MTREEEIKQAAKNRADQYKHPVDWNNCYHHYIQGAEWADQHPRKGLWDSKKVCSWIGNHLLTSHQGYILEDLRKAMEE